MDCTAGAESALTDVGGTVDEEEDDEEVEEDVENEEEEMEISSMTTSSGGWEVSMSLNGSFSAAESEF